MRYAMCMMRIQRRPIDTVVEAPGLGSVLLNFVGGVPGLSRLPRIGPVCPTFAAKNCKFSVHGVVNRLIRPAQHEFGHFPKLGPCRLVKPPENQYIDESLLTQPISSDGSFIPCCRQPDDDR